MDPAKKVGRVADDRYRALPEGHRTTFVVGMAEMLEQMVRYLDAKKLAAFEPILEYQRLLESDDLREALDSHMTNEPSGLKGAIVSTFFAMLVKKSAARRRKTRAAKLLFAAIEKE